MAPSGPSGSMQMQMWACLLALELTNKIDKQPSAMLLETGAATYQSGKHPHKRHRRFSQKITWHPRMFLQMPFSTLSRAQAKVPAQRARAVTRGPTYSLQVTGHRLMYKRVMALIDTVAVCSLIYGKPEEFPSPTARSDAMVTKQLR